MERPIAEAVSALFLTQSRRWRMLGHMRGRLLPLGITAAIVVAAWTPGLGADHLAGGAMSPMPAAAAGATGRAAPRNSAAWGAYDMVAGIVAVAGGLKAAPAAPSPAPQIAVQGRVGRARVAGGQVQRLTAVVRSNVTVGSTLVDLEVYDSANHKVFQATQRVDLAANVPVVVTRPFTLSHRAFGGTYYLVVGVFGPHWSPLYSWGTADQFAVTGPLPTIVAATGSVSPVLAYPGGTATLTARISASHHGLSHALVDVELYQASGPRLCQRITTGVRVPKDGSTQISVQCAIPAGQASGDYVMKVGVFGPKWSPLYVWNAAAATLTIVARPS